jgi:hypothetical protein
MRGEKGGGRRELYSYEETSAMPVVIIDEGQGKTHKTGYITLYSKLFKGVMCASQKWNIEKNRKLFIYLCHTYDNTVV